MGRYCNLSGGWGRSPSASPSDLGTEVDEYRLGEVEDEDGP